MCSGGAAIVATWTPAAVQWGAAQRSPGRAVAVPPAALSSTAVRISPLQSFAPVGGLAKPHPCPG